jgi:hypothetical protein
VARSVYERSERIVYDLIPQQGSCRDSLRICNPVRYGKEVILNGMLYLPKYVHVKRGDAAGNMPHFTRGNGARENLNINHLVNPYPVPSVHTEVHNQISQLG